MKATPALLALAAAGVAAFVLFRPRATPAATPSFWDRFSTFADAFPASPVGVAIKSNVESGYGDLVDWLRRIDPRPDPIGELNSLQRGLVPEPDVLSFTPAGPMGMAF